MFALKNVFLIVGTSLRLDICKLSDSDSVPVAGRRLTRVNSSGIEMYSLSDLNLCTPTTEDTAREENRLSDTNELFGS